MKARTQGWYNRCNPLAAACRLLWYNEPAEFILKPEDVHSTTQNWRSMCAQHIAVLRLFRLIAMWVTNSMYNGLLVRISAHTYLFCIFIWKAPFVLQSIVFISAHIKNLHIYCNTLCTGLCVHQGGIVPEVSYIIMQFTPPNAAKRLCKYIFASVLFVSAAQNPVILEFCFLLTHNVTWYYMNK